MSLPAKSFDPAAECPLDGVRVVEHKRNPRLIIVRVSGWGQDGPYRDRPGFGTLVESMSGYAARTGFADREPVLPPTALADMVAGLYGAFAVMVALPRRRSMA